MNKHVRDNCNLLIDFLKSLEDEFIGLHKGLKTEVVNIKLPLDFQYFLNWSNGFSIFGTEILGIGNTQFDLLKTVSREQNETSNLMPNYMIPFSPAGNGDYYCFNLKDGLDENGLCPVVYWQWNYSNADRNEIVNDSFIEWLKELIDDSLLDEEE